MMGVRTPETCWAVNKRQVLNWWDCCIWLVTLFELNIPYRIFDTNEISIWPYLDNSNLSIAPCYVLNFWQVHVYFLSRQGVLLSVKHKYFVFRFVHTVIIIIIIIYLSWSWATCWPVPVSRIQKSLQRSAMIPSASWGKAFHYPG